LPEQPTHTFFNSRCAEYKTPFGAVPAGQTVTWRLTVPERLGYVDPHLVLTKDREDPVHYRMDFDGQTPGVNHFVFQLAPTTSGLYFYHFDLYTDFRKIYRTANGEGELTWVNGLDWQLTVYEPDFKTPDWIKDGTMYQIFPDRFYEGVPNKPLPFADRIYRPDKTGEPYFWPNEQSDGYLNMDYYGGDFAGIQQKLPYLEELGVTCIYLNPIFEAHANHRYNTANYLKADPLLGTNEDFAALCAEAKKHGIRIILDGVFSHTGSDSLYFNREGRYGPGEDKLLIGEVWEDATTKEAFDHRRTYLRGHGLDATMNYPFRNAAVAFARGEDASAVGEQIMSICENYPKPALDCAMNFLSTHDTERGITAIAGEPANGRDRYWQSKRMIPGDRIDDALRRVLLAYAMLYTLPGVPCVYYGDEIGMQGYRDPFNRAYFDWNSTERRLRVPLSNLARLRRSCDAFDGGSMELVEASADVLHYRRVGKEQSAEIILNNGPHLIVRTAFGKQTEVNPGGFTILVEDNQPQHVGYFKYY